MPHRDDKQPESKSVHLVVQRYRRCELLLEESHWVEVAGGDASSSHCGLLVYVSFASSAAPSDVEQAAWTVMNLSLLTTGGWGDGETPRSILDLADDEESRTSVTVVPQANLISKVKSQGKSIQYHGQVDKETGQQLYHYFCDCLCAIILERQCLRLNNEQPEWFLERQKALQAAQSSTPSPDLAPNQLFRDATKYSAWDDDGFPINNNEGAPVSKSALKKLRKQLDAHTKRNDKWRTQHPGQLPIDFAEEQRRQSQLVLIDKARWESVLDPTYCRVVCGSFGLRQGLRVDSDMGPFCHVVQL